MMKKRGVEMTMTTIIVAVLVLIILTISSVFIYRTFTTTSTTVSSTTSCEGQKGGGVCVLAGDSCPAGKSVEINTANCLADKGKKCCIPSA